MAWSVSKSAIPWLSGYATFGVDPIFTTDEEPAGDFVAAESAGQVIKILHGDGYIAWMLACRIEGYSLTIKLPTEDAREIADDTEFAANLALMFSNRMYTEKAVHCPHMQPFLESVKNAARRQDFRTTIRTVLGLSKT